MSLVESAVRRESASEGRIAVLFGENAGLVAQEVVGALVSGELGKHLEDDLSVGVRGEYLRRLVQAHQHYERLK